MRYDADLNFTFGHTARVVFGVDAVAQIGDLCTELGATRAFTVTDSFLATKTDYVHRLERALGPRLVGVWPNVVLDPTAASIDAGAKAARDAGADLLISLGGGSVIDTAKGMAVVLREGGRVLDHEGYHFLARRQTPHIAIPTTAGTGSEMTIATVITDPARGQKTFIGSFYLLPDVAVLDPALTVALPQKLTAATAMDAMSHAVEALFSVLRQPLSDACALRAISLIAEHLPRCLSAPDDLVARGQMLIAASLAGTAFSNAMASLNHAMAHSLGVRYHVHHGTLNAVLLPHTMRFFVPDAADRLAQVALALGLDTRGLGDERAAHLAADRIQEFVREIGLPGTLAELGVPQDGLRPTAELSLGDGAIMYSPRPVTEADEVERLLEAAYA